MKKKQHTKEFKEEAVVLAKQSGMTFEQVAELPGNTQFGDGCEVQGLVD